MHQHLVVQFVESVRRQNPIKYNELLAVGDNKKR